MPINSYKLLSVFSLRGDHMKVNDINRAQGINKYQQFNQKDQKIKENIHKKDEIVISSEAKALLEQTKELNSSNKLEQLKEQVEHGTYHVDAQLIAEKMLNLFDK